MVTFDEANKLVLIDRDYDKDEIKYEIMKWLEQPENMPLANFIQDDGEFLTFHDGWRCFFRKHTDLYEGFLNDTKTS